jgi:hypothetical protein
MDKDNLQDLWRDYSVRPKHVSEGITHDDNDDDYDHDGDDDDDDDE